MSAASALAQNLQNLDTAIRGAAVAWNNNNALSGSVYSADHIKNLVDAGKRAYLGQPLTEVEMVHLVRIGMEKIVYGNPWFQQSSREGKCLFEGSLGDKATSFGIDVTKYNERAMHYYNTRISSLNSMGTLGNLAAISASQSPLTVPIDNTTGANSAAVNSAAVNAAVLNAQLQSQLEAMLKTGKSAAELNYDGVRQNIELIEEEDVVMPSFHGLRLEKTFPMEFAVPARAKIDATMVYCIDMADIDNRERDYQDEIYSLRRQAQARYFKAVGMPLDPSHAYPGGYRSKSGKRGADEIDFNRQIFSFRRDYYHEHPDQTDLSALNPSSDAEIKKGIEELKKAYKTNGKNGCVEGAISNGKRKKPDS